MVLMALLSVGCDAYHWPPHENKLRTMFLESKSVLVEIELEMISDGLDFIGPGRERHRKDGPQLTDVQKAKYAALFSRLPYLWNLSRNNEVTFINVNPPPILGSRRSVLYSFTHRQERARQPFCEDTKRSQTCGQCSVALGDQWYIDYLWHPDDLGPDWDGRVGEGLPSPEEINEQFGQVLDECLADGLIESGFDQREVQIRDPED